MNNVFKVTEYVTRNGMLILRVSLPANDYESFQTLWKNQYGNMEGFPYLELGIEEVITCPHCGGIVK